MELWKWIAIAVAVLVGGFLLVSMFTPPKPAVEEVTFTNGDIALAGTLTLPPTEGPHPAVILISGSGPQNRDEEIPGVSGYQPFRVIADHLARNGIAVLRYDDRGVGGSTGDYATATSADFATDAEAALSYLLGRDEIDPEQIGLLGHSEGA
jgi:dienelactone hydrolase